MLEPSANEIVYGNENIINNKYNGIFKKINYIEATRSKINDGFYMNIPPFVTDKNLEKFLNRIQREKEKLNENGEPELVFIYLYIV